MSQLFDPIGEVPDYLEPLFLQAINIIAEGVEDAAEDLLVSDFGQVLLHDLPEDIRIFLTGVHEFRSSEEDRNPDLINDYRYMLGMEFANMATAGRYVDE